MTISTVSLDLARNVFPPHAAHNESMIVVRKQLDLTKDGRCPFSRAKEEACTGLNSRNPLILLDREVEPELV